MFVYSCVMQLGERLILMVNSSFLQSISFFYFQFSFELLFHLPKSEPHLEIFFIFYHISLNPFRKSSQPTPTCET